MWLFPSSSITGGVGDNCEAAFLFPDSSPEPLVLTVNTTAVVSAPVRKSLRHQLLHAINLLSWRIPAVLAWFLAAMAECNDFYLSVDAANPESTGTTCA